MGAEGARFLLDRRSSPSARVFGQSPKRRGSWRRRRIAVTRRSRCKVTKYSTPDNVRNAVPPASVGWVVWGWRLHSSMAQFSSPTSTIIHWSACGRRRKLKCSGAKRTTRPRALESPRFRPRCPRSAMPSLPRQENETASCLSSAADSVGPDSGLRARPLVSGTTGARPSIGLAITDDWLP